MSDEEQTRRSGGGGVDVVVVGGGAVGVCTAYYLSSLGRRVAVVEKTGVACAASGKAGGFLARDWCDGGPTEALARAGFDLHASLAEEHDNPWEYRRLNTIAVKHFTRSKDKVRTKSTPWIDGSSSKEQVLGTPETTAQVTPGKFVRALMQAAQSRGAVLVEEEVTGLITAEGDGDGREGKGGEATTTADATADARNPRITGVRLASGQELRAPKVVLAMGPWTHVAREWLRSVPDITGDKAHSIVLRPPQDSGIDATAVFIGYSDKGKMEHPEIYPRPDGSVYVCGCGDNTPLPPSAGDITPSAGRCEALREIAGRLSSHLHGLVPETTQACYLPISPDGLPAIGELCSGLYVAAGHSCWGILMSPSTGRAMAEFLTSGAATSVDIRAFDPKRLI
ncbi:FAD-dependent oxidoreductase [Salpingoeca rosetta]|uniref:FAD-dependent oxidoreductase n=1 Tax=Salpingoeca rosetta (strain ATCC 50818 / BSB-021) TaxID=946362 RepID=F2UN52_SALR5|nr:FAD-dependent oxidoreductase [Salpingoeca rosetta]EGD78551.1 FAD-dependent oxidoreductase [Salpingoeca rosetta]|eukprot:XP_004989500.1 FAD-dependent oxidoreductase [Salpingoeca rosetta]